MLSSQTKDEITGSTMRYLVNEKALTIDMIIKTDEKDLN